MDDSIDVDAVVPTLDVPAAAISTLRAAGEGRLEDLRLVQRAIRQHAEPSKVAALAYGFDLAPAAVIGVCRANNTRPQHAMAVAIALRNGDAGSAYDDIIAAWPDVDGGWERHTHPSLRGPHRSQCPRTTTRPARSLTVGLVAARRPLRFLPAR